MHPPFRRYAQILIAATLLLLPPGAALRAAMLGDSVLSYQAERTVTVNGRSYTGMVFHVPGHERHEQEIAGVSEVILLDVAAKRGALILPELNAYVAFAFPALMAELDDASWRRDPVGHETVNGVRTVKYRIDHAAADGSHAQGFAWISAEGVLMRIEGTFTHAGAQTGTAIRMELAGLQVGPQDRALFGVPPGLVKLPSAALQAFLTGRPTER